MLSISEDKMQMDFATWCDKQPFIIEHFHVANERQVSKIQGAYLKKKGVKSGVCDHWVILQDKVIAIELKTPDGTVSDKQKKFIAKLEKANIPVKVCYSLYEATQFVKKEVEQLRKTKGE